MFTKSVTIFVIIVMALVGLVYLDLSGYDLRGASAVQITQVYTQESFSLLVLLSLLLGGIAILLSATVDRLTQIRDALRQGGRPIPTPPAELESKAP